MISIPGRNVTNANCGGRQRRTWGRKKNSCARMLERNAITNKKSAKTISLWSDCTHHALQSD